MKILGLFPTWRSARAAIAVAVTMAPLSLVGCGTSSAPKTAKVQVGDMPEGAEWTGVYYSELYGYLHLLQEGNAVNGKWERSVKDKWGEVHGTATGDVFRFSWTERVKGVIGPKSSRTGKGYFKYKRPEGENVDDIIVGEIGVGNDEMGEPWEAIKQRNVTPDLASIGGTDSADLGGGDWDTDNKENGTPEAPKEPEAPTP